MRDVDRVSRTAAESGVAAESGAARERRAGAAGPAAESGRDRPGGRWRRYAALTVGGSLAVTLATVVQWWFAPFAVGLGLGLLTAWRGSPGRAGLRAASAITVLAGTAGWAVPLLRRAADGEPVVGTARTTAALAGLPALGWLLIGVTLLLAAVQGLAGLWLGRAAAGLRRV
ncbi:hypothetical protein ACFVXG_01070 [Kitasatospora sp. NPDC058162]|uniref:hypothetical protein n=1 Tax=Kitasatospora sp. NPDC058162 TaxID=3346362 RepID=UPI0036DE9674